MADARPLGPPNGTCAPRTSPPFIPYNLCHAIPAEWLFCWRAGFATPVQLAHGRVARVCLNYKSGSTALRQGMINGLTRRGIAMRSEPSCRNTTLCEGFVHLPLDIPGLFKAPIYMVVRHPVSRMLSGYLDGKGKWAVASVSWARSTLWMNKSFVTMVRFLTSLPPQKAGVHFRPQTLQCEWCVQRDAGRITVLHLERYETWRAMLARALEISEDALPSFHSLRGDAAVHQYYTENLARSVERWAKSDMRLLGYTPWPFPETC